MFVVILAATQENRVAKRADFSTRAEADAHVVLFLDTFPDAFTASMPDAPDGHWFIDMVAKTITIVPPPPPDFDAIDQATVDRLLLESGVMRALATALFQAVNDVRVLKGDSTITATQFKTYLKGLIRT